jgi:hypothetical protein
VDQFPYSGERKETPTLLGPLERASHDHWTNVSNGANIVSASLSSPEKGIQFPKHFVI